MATRPVATVRSGADFPAQESSARLEVLAPIPLKLSKQVSAKTQGVGGAGRDPSTPLRTVLSPEK